MNSHSNLVSAINGFIAWERPWDFIKSVSSSSILSSVERTELEKIWKIAAGEDTWLLCKDLYEGCAKAQKLLAATYPWLPESAISQLVNGAAYQWR